MFSVEINHGGFFCGVGLNKSYVDGRIDYFDRCEVDSWSPLWIKDFIEQLGHDALQCHVYWLFPGKKLGDGLRIVDSDADTLNMAAVVPKSVQRDALPAPRATTATHDVRGKKKKGKAKAK